MAEGAVAVARAERARAIVLALLVVLGLLSLLVVLHVARIRPALALLPGIFLLVPLLLPVGGILGRNRRTYAWATFCLAPHFAYALTEIVANPALRHLATAMLFSALALAIALVAWLRLTNPARAARAGTGS